MFACQNPVETGSVKIGLAVLQIQITGSKKWCRNGYKKEANKTGGFAAGPFLADDTFNGRTMGTGSKTGNAPCL